MIPNKTEPLQGSIKTFTCFVLRFYRRINLIKASRLIPNPMLINNISFTSRSIHMNNPKK
jgi:hypothetical protein